MNSGASLGIGLWFFYSAITQEFIDNFVSCEPALLLAGLWATSNCSEQTIKKFDLMIEFYNQKNQSKLAFKANYEAVSCVPVNLDTLFIL